MTTPLKAVTGVRRCQGERWAQPGVMASWVGWGPTGGCGSRVLDEAGGCDLRRQQGPRKGEQAWEALLGFLEGVS